MAGYDISVDIGVQGETKFKKALTECQNSVKQLDSALKANAAEYDANADALGKNVDRARLLNESIALQKNMVQGLSGAIEYANKEYGEAGAQTTKYVIAMNKAREAVAKMEKELADMDREMEEAGRDSIKVGRQLEQGIGDGAEDTAKKLSDMMSDIRSQLSSISGSVGITATIDVIKSVGEGIENLSEQTQEYRRTVSYLEQNAKDAGQAWADIEQHLFRVAANTGSLEDASEGISNLLAAGLDSKEVADAVTMLLAAVVKFPQTYKFENLAESLRNTIEEKQAVGQFSEMLLGLGVDLETFNSALEKAADKEAAQDLVLSFGANRGLEKTIAEYETVNAKMLAANEATLTYKKSLSDLSTEMSGIGTAYTELTTATVDTVGKILTNTQVDEWLESALNGITGIINEIGDMIAGTGEWSKENIAKKELEAYAKEEKRLETLIAEAREAGNTLIEGQNQTALDELRAGRAALVEALKAEGIDVGIAEATEEAGKEAGASLVEGATGEIKKAEPVVEKTIRTWFDSLMGSLIGERWTGEAYDPMSYFESLEPTAEELHQAQLFGEEVGEAWNEGFEKASESSDGNELELAKEAKATAETISEIVPEGKNLKSDLDATLVEVSKSFDENEPELAKEAKAAAETISKIVPEGKDLKSDLDATIVEMSKSFGESTPGVTAAVQGFVNVVNKGLEGIVFPDIAGAAQEQINRLNRIINSEPVYNGTTYTPSGGGRINDDSKTMHMTFNVNGRAFAEATIDDFNNAQGAAVSRGITLNA